MHAWKIWLYLSGMLLLLIIERRLPVTAQPRAASTLRHYYVADTLKDRLLQMEDTTGWNTVTLGKRGTGIKEFRNPTRLFVDAQKRIYVCDTDNHRIVRMDDITGKNWTAIGSRGRGEKQFQFPISIQVESNGRITVLDLGNTCIVQMDDMSGKNWRTLNVPEVNLRFSDPNKAQEHEELQHLMEAHPTNVAVDAQGRLYYPDQKRSCITRVDDITGKNPLSLGTPGAKEMRKGAFYWPQMIGLDAQDRLYVLSVPGYLVRVDDMSGKNWTDLYGPAPGIATFSIVDGNTLCVTPFSGVIHNRTETSDGTVIFTDWKPNFSWFVSVFAR